MTGLFDFQGLGGLGGLNDMGLDPLAQIAQALQAAPPPLPPPLPPQPTGNLMDPVKLLNSPAAQAGKAEELARQTLTSQVNPNVRPQVPLERGVPTQVNLPVTPGPSSPTSPPVPTRLAQPRPPVATPLDVAQNESETNPVVKRKLTADDETDVGATLTGQKAATTIPDDGTATNTRGPETVATAEAKPETTDFSSKNAAATLAQALRGVTAPKPPELQRIASPNVPRPTSVIKSGDLQALLLALNAGGARAKPTTLGK